MYTRIYTTYINIYININYKISPHYFSLVYIQSTTPHIVVEMAGPTTWDLEWTCLPPQDGNGFCLCAHRINLGLSGYHHKISDTSGPPKRSAYCRRKGREEIQETPATKEQDHLEDHSWSGGHLTMHVPSSSLSLCYFRGGHCYTTGLSGHPLMRPQISTTDDFQFQNPW